MPSKNVNISKFLYSETHYLEANVKCPLSFSPQSQSQTLPNFKPRGAGSSRFIMG